MKVIRLSSVRVFGLLAVLGVLTLTLAGCGRSSATSDNGPANGGVRPTAGAALPETPDETTITIENGAFVEDTLDLQQNEPVVIHVVNRDATAYRFHIGELITTDPAIAAAATTNVSLTTPNATTAEGQLLPASGDQPLDTIAVEVQAPSGNTP